MKKHQKFYGLFHYATGKRIWNPNNFPTPRAGSYIVATRITSADKKAREAGWVPNGTTYIVEKLITRSNRHHQTQTQKIMSKYFAEQAVNIVDDIEQLSHDLKTKISILRDEAGSARDLIERQPSGAYAHDRVHRLKMLLANLEACEEPVERAYRLSREVSSGEIF